MLKSSKLLIGILLLFFIFLVGCSADLEVSPNHRSDVNADSNKPMSKKIYSPVKITYAVDNPIEITQINLSESTDHQQSYFQINGLVNQAVEDNINEAIKELFNQMVPYVTGEKLAPYRGIQSIVKQDKNVKDGSLSVLPTFNSNNVLSVVAYVSGTYYQSTNDFYYFSMIDSLNFDLNTGEILLIEDVFTNDADCFTIINDAIVDELKRARLASNIDYDEYASLNLVAPFSGINNEQKFFLSYDGINVIIDHNNPEFDTGGFMYTQVIVPFYSSNGYFAITKRFYDENQSIYAKEAFSKRFLRDYQMTINRETASFNKDGIEWNVSISRPENLGQPFIEIMDILRDEQEEMVTTWSRETPILSVEQNMYASQIGRFINISSTLFIATANEGQWQENSYTYSETGELIELGDLFAEGYDYSTLINSAIDTAIKDYGLPLDVDGEELLNNLMFTINDSHISFVTKIHEFSPGSTQLFFNIPYDEIGYKNLKLFD